MFTFSSNAIEVERALVGRVERQVPFATAMALNDTATHALDLVKKQMDLVFDRPTPFAKNAFMVWRATKQTLVAEVKERPSVTRKHFLKVQERGGKRPQTGMELGLASRMGYSGAIAALIPAAKAKRDSYGNWSTGERNRALSGIGGQRDVYANTTAASRKRNRNRAEYFVPAPGELSPGIWKREGEKLTKIAMFLDELPSYKPTLGFIETAEKAARDKFPEFFDRRFAEAMATAR
jgi:hypothetical protein